MKEKGPEKELQAPCFPSVITSKVDVTHTDGSEWKGSVETRSGFGCLRAPLQF